MNADRAKDKARTLARKQARKQKQDGWLPITQQRPMKHDRPRKAPKGWEYVETSVED